MNTKELKAYDWALTQQYHSVAADHARTLAEYIAKMGNIESAYPEWQGRFPSVADAITRHTANQDAVIKRGREMITILADGVRKAYLKHHLGDDDIGWDEH